MRLNFDDPPARGILSVEFVEAEYDANYVDAARPQTYCIVWVLEKIKWRRRKSQPAAGLRPAWGAAFDFDEVRDDSKVVVDVWCKGELAGAHDEFFGKVTLRIDELLRKPAGAWHELVPGRIQLRMGWTPTAPDGGATGATVPLLLDAAGAPPPRPFDEPMATACAAARVRAAAHAAPRPPAPAPAPAPAGRDVVRSVHAEVTTQPIADRPADEYGDEEFEEEPVEDEFEEMVVDSVAQRTKAPPAMAPSPAPRSRRRRRCRRRSRRRRRAARR